MTRQEMLRRFKRAGVSSKRYRLDPPPHTYKGHGLAQASDNRWLVYTARNKFLYDLAVFHAEAAACDELYFRVMDDFKLHLLACATLLFGILFGACHLFPAAPMLRTLSLIGLSLAALSFIILKIRQEWLLGKFYGRCSDARPFYQPPTCKTSCNLPTDHIALPAKEKTQTKQR